MDKTSERHWMYRKINFRGQVIAILEYCETNPKFQFSITACQYSLVEMMGGQHIKTKLASNSSFPHSGLIRISIDRNGRNRICEPFTVIASLKSEKATSFIKNFNLDAVLKCEINQVSSWGIL